MHNRVILMVAAAWIAQAQVKPGREIGSGVVTLNSGVTFRHETVVEPPKSYAGFQTAGSASGFSGNSWDHALYERNSQSYFGYEMTVLPGDDPSTRRVLFGPVNFARLERPLRAVAGDLQLNAAPPPRFPAPQVVHNGDTIAMDVAVSTDGGFRIVDYLHFSFGTTPKPAPAASAAPADFTLDDGPLKFTLEPPDVFIDRQQFLKYVIMYNSPGGATLWFYFPDRGRYLLSLVPHEGFTKAGAVRANVVTFSADGHDYEIRMPDPIAGREKAWNLYVMHDPSYLPLPGVVKYVVGSLGRLEDLLKK
jgi:hypothetical protein